MILSSLTKPNIFTMYSGVYVFVIAALLIAGVVCVRVFAKYSAMPHETVSVKLIGKKKIPMQGFRFYFCLQFLTEEQKLIEVFADNELQYDSYYEGDTGMLTHKGTKMIKFERTHINPPN